MGPKGSKKIKNFLGSILNAFLKIIALKDLLCHRHTISIRHHVGKTCRHIENSEFHRQHHNHMTMDFH